MNQKPILLLLLCILSVFNINAQTSNLVWAKQMGGPTDDYGVSTAVDGNGNVYTTGYFTGTADFDPGLGNYYMTSTVGSGDVFISKLDASGNFVWAKQLMGRESEAGYAIKVDTNGNVYTAGYFYGSVDFDPGSGIYNMTSFANSSDIFILKLDAYGNFVWAKQLGGDYYDFGYCMAVDEDGNVYTSGQFSGTADFDPGTSIHNMISSGPADIFISKLDTYGNFLWAKQFTVESGGTGRSITFDVRGNVYTTGNFLGTADFDPGLGTYNLSSYPQNAFISKLDALGNFIWAKQLISGNSFGYSIAIDFNGNVFSTGGFGGTTDFDPGPSIYSLTSSGSEDVYVSKLDAYGNFLWAKQFSATGFSVGNVIAVNTAGEIYTSGIFDSVTDFDPGPAIYNLATTGGPNIFISKLDAYGNFLWAKRLGGTYSDFTQAMIIDANENLYLTGGFGDTVDFDPGQGTYNLTSAGSDDIFVTKFSQDIPINTIYPKLYLSTSSINAGQSTTFTGAAFKQNGSATISILGPGGFSQSINNINTDAQGGFVYNFMTTSMMLTGFYNVTGIDNASGNASPLKSFQLINNTTPARTLRITSPSIIASSNVNKTIKLGWTDNPSHLSTLIPNTSLVNASYKLEYNKDNAGWQLITVKPFIGLYKQLSAFIYDFIPSLPGVYQFRVTDILDPLNIDISANVTVNLDASGAMMDYAWDYSGNRPTIKPIGVAADGTARVYVKISKKAGNNKTISSVSIVLRDSSNLSVTQPVLIGKIMKAIDTSMYSIEANAAALTSVTSNTSGSGNVFWFWYVAPDDFVRNNNDTLASSRFINIVGTVTYSDNSTDPVAEKVEIVRPPLMFVHGIGGDETTWDNFSYLANGVNKYFTKSYLSQWKFKRANNMFAGGSYIQNAQILLSLGGTGILRASQDNTESYDPNSFRYYLKQMRDQHYASNKVDYIAHSMGGDMARTAINLYASQYIPDVAFTSKFKNYGKGFINKLITLNTPHNGSPIADLTIDKLSQNFIVKKLLQGVYTFANGDKLVGSFFNTTPFTGKLDFNSPTEALKNLRYDANGIKFLTSNVKNHLISGDLLTGGEDCLDAYNLIKNDDDLSFIVQLSAALFATDCIAIDQLYTNYGVNDFFENSDFVVPLSSQLPNKNLLSSGSDYSIFYGSDRNHLSIHNSNKNPDVGQKVFDLLNASISSTSFSNTIAANTSAGSIIYKPTSINTYSEWIDTSKIIITSPVRQSNSSVDSTINISVRLKDTLNFKNLNVFFQSNIYSSASKATNQIFNVQVNPVYVDSQTIVATAVYDSLGNDVYYTDSISINILKDPIINGFYVTPKSKYLDSGQVYIPIYNLIHSTYISNVSIFDPALNISVADTNVVTYSNLQKNFIAKDTGTTFAVVSYKNFKDTIFFIISTTDKAINSICPGSTITFNSVATGTSYQWQVDIGSGYTNVTNNTFYSGANTTTLTLVNAPSAWYGYKYRCVVSNGTSSYYGSDNILKFSSIWIGATDTTWENPQNWSCGSLPDGNTDIIISGGFANYPIANSNVLCRSLSVNPGAMLKVKTGYTLTITGK